MSPWAQSGQEGYGPRTVGRKDQGWITGAGYHEGVKTTKSSVLSLSALREKSPARKSTRGTRPGSGGSDWIRFPETRRVVPIESAQISELLAARCSYSCSVLVQPRGRRDASEDIIREEFTEDLPLEIPCRETFRDSPAARASSGNL